MLTIRTTRITDESLWGVFGLAGHRPHRAFTPSVAPSLQTSRSQNARILAVCSRSHTAFLSTRLTEGPVRHTSRGLFF